ncbi:MAG: VacJ family lipoprotein [Thermodesulfobacteriota bacterium]|nr:VacJ family lipoprotein [Thermodesulfobacteriota bacterium]
MIRTVKIHNLLLIFIILIALAGPCWCASLNNVNNDSLMTEQGDDDFFEDLYGDDGDVDAIADPLETFNRGMFWFNDKCYFYVLKPLACGFRVVPEHVRTGLGNMFDNLKSPLYAVNAFLQFKFKRMASETTRLVVNSTIGLAGFFDLADSLWGLEKKEEDFGQTLGYYGVGEGFYLVIPVLGASSLRDGLSIIPDGYADPIYWLANFEATLACKGVSMVNRTSLDRDTYESIVEEQLDPYLFVRDAYTQHRRGKVAD